MRLTRVVLGKLFSGVLFSVGALAPTIAFAQAETEPNDSKAQANLFTLPAASTPGVITGNSVSAATTGLDYFRVTTAAQATPGFYRHRLIVTSAIVGHTATVRGLNQIAGVPGTVDNAVQTSSAATTPARFIQWYTSQTPADLIVRITGVAATTANYSLDYEVTPVTELVGPTIPVGSRTITSVGQSAPQTDTDLWVYDGARAAIPTFGNDDESPAGTLGSRLTRTYAAGTFHLAISNFNVANNLGSPPDDSFRTGLVLDFPGAIVNDNTVIAGINLATLIDGVARPATKTGPFEVVFVQFQVGSPTFDIADASAAEGNAGTTNMLFPVTLTGAPAGTVTVNFATADGTATAGSDYTAATGTLTFAPGQTSQNVTVSVTGDTTVEADETFFVNLSAPSAGTQIGDGSGQGTITNDDVAAISVGDASVVEGNSGTVDLIAPVTLNTPAFTPVTVAFATADNTATAGSDYTATSGVLTFAPGVTALGVTVSVTGDTTVEADETFFVNLSAPTNATIADGQGVETITNDDGTDENAELSHGFRVNGSLASSGGADTDTYPISQKPNSSYEVVVDAASGDISPVLLERMNGTTVLQTADPVGTGTARSLRWANDTTNTVDTETVRVSSGGCTTDCGADDTYRLRAYETTYSIPRFNNSGTQITVLLLQNPTDYPIAANVYFWNAAGTQLHVELVNVPAKNLTVINTASITPVNGQSGSVTVTHNGRFGDLAGKTVALEPATGFSFDSPMLIRSR